MVSFIHSFIHYGVPTSCQGCIKYWGIKHSPALKDFFAFHLIIMEEFKDIQNG